jgi:hypothetical protein
MHSGLIGNPKMKRIFVRRKSRWEDNVKTNFEEIRCEDVNRIHPAQNEVHCWTPF